MGWDENLENTRDEVEGQVKERFGQEADNEQTTDNEQMQNESSYDQGESSYEQSDGGSDQSEGSYEQGSEQEETSYTEDCPSSHHGNGITGEPGDAVAGAGGPKGLPAVFPGAYSGAGSSRRLMLLMQ